MKHIVDECNWQELCNEIPCSACPFSKDGLCILELYIRSQPVYGEEKANAVDMAKGQDKTVVNVILKNGVPVPLPKWCEDFMEELKDRKTLTCDRCMYFNPIKYTCYLIKKPHFITGNMTACEKFKRKVINCECEKESDGE